MYYTIKEDGIIRHIKAEPGTLIPVKSPFNVLGVCYAGDNVAGIPETRDMQRKVVKFDKDKWLSEVKNG